jgi:Tic22-like family
MTIPPQALSNLKLPSVLTAAQVTERLNAIPGFILVNATGHALTARGSDSKAAPSVGVFLRQKGATDFLETLKKRDQTLVAELKLKAVGIGELYQKALNPQEAISLSFVPDPAEVEQAKQLLKQQGKPETFVGVPLFMGQLTGKGLLTLTQNDKTVIPAFFSLADLTVLLENYNKTRPEGSPEARPALTTLEFLLTAWRKTPDPTLAQVQLVVNKAVLSEVKAVSENKGS